MVEIIYESSGSHTKVNINRPKHYDGFLEGRVYVCRCVGFVVLGEDVSNGCLLSR